jgi:hypothetical protein
MFSFGYFWTEIKKHGPAFGIVSFLTSSAILLFTYRLGSLRVDKGNLPGLRDIGTYFEGGETILAGGNPYENSNFRIGPMGGFFVGVFARLTPDFLGATLIMALSIFGFAYFMGTFTGYQRLITFPWTFFGILLFISSQRENLVNIQITGVLALCAACGIRLIDRKQSNYQTLGVLLIAVAAETKPHLCGLFIVSVLIYRKEYGYIGKALLAIISAHVLISIYVKEVITWSWIELILSLNKDANIGKLPERIAFETPFEFFGVSPQVSVLIMNCIMASMSLVVIVVSKKFNTLYLGLIVPSFGVFFHYYDLALAFGLMLTMLYVAKQYTILFIILGFFLVPQNYNSVPNTLLVFLLLGILAITTFQKNYLKVILHLMAGFASWFLYISVIKFLEKEIQIHELSMSLSILISLPIWLHLVKSMRPRNRKSRIKDY